MRVNTISVRIWSAILAAVLFLGTYQTHGSVELECTAPPQTLPLHISAPCTSFESLDDEQQERLALDVSKKIFPGIFFKEDRALDTSSFRTALGWITVGGFASFPFLMKQGGRKIAPLLLLTYVGIVPTLSSYYHYKKDQTQDKEGEWSKLSFVRESVLGGLDPTHLFKPEVWKGFGLSIAAAFLLPTLMRKLPLPKFLSAEAHIEQSREMRQKSMAREKSRKAHFLKSIPEILAWSAVEEWVFRGFLQPRLLRIATDFEVRKSLKAKSCVTIDADSMVSQLGSKEIQSIKTSAAVKAKLGQSIPFALSHGSLSIPHSLLGYILGDLALKEDGGTDLSNPLFLHFIWNAFALGLLTFR